MKQKKVTIGSLIDDMSELREKRRVLAAQDKELVAAYDVLEDKLLALMDAEKVQKSTGSTASASVSETMQFNFDGDDGFDKFMAFVARHKYFHLVQRRVSVPAARELMQMKGAVPGLAPYIKREISLRNL